MIKVGHCLGMAGFYLGLGLLLFNFKSSLPSAANLYWRSGLDGGLRTLCCGFDSYSRYSEYSIKIELTFMSILCKLHKASKGVRPSGSNANLVWPLSLNCCARLGWSFVKLHYGTWATSKLRHNTIKIKEPEHGETTSCENYLAGKITGHPSFEWRRKWRSADCLPHLRTMSQQFCRRL